MVFCCMTNDDFLLFVNILQVLRSKIEREFYGIRNTCPILSSRAEKKAVRESEE